MAFKNTLYLLLVGVVVCSCTKSPSADLLVGTWLEEGGNKSKLVFENGLFYFFHDSQIDTSTYLLDQKHSNIWTAPLDSSSGGKSYQLDWHKRKKILTVIGLFPTAFSSKSKNYYKKQ